MGHKTFHEMLDEEQAEQEATIMNNLDNQIALTAEYRDAVEKLMDNTAKLASERNEAIQQLLKAERNHDFADYLKRQWAWSLNTFGPALRTGGIIEHIKKELGEIEKKPYDLSEWCDIIILALDGYWRHGGSPERCLAILNAKQEKNFARNWPDWKTLPENSAIEHDRSGDTDKDSS